ncbi:TauD/TfdA dioxygenase family protein [Phenylobacterium sp.]|jgi:taurine dioxygenase|uniref:TauD/TfdA dioxygenase family protein n=1 Tax=Phenylobacterium sp. TaxID=1871053 RepID=UPI002E343D8E|nr:TauD/TfdA family dioxygenase [Phenylobacterium sp.]HEX2560137.1 TauD/TfdA family dioxygenase [Phenylobacterium sp.]
MSLATLQSRPANDAKPSRIVIEPVTPIIGAEISGVDLTRPLDAETFAEIRQAIRKWRVIFFRDQDITNDQLKTFGRYFGPLTPAHPIAEGLDEHPEIWERAVDEYRVRRSENDNLKPGARKPRDYKGWHIDITFVANPNAYSLLYGVQIPEYGGDTLFANLIAAYEGLSPKIKALIDGLQAVHQTTSYDFGGPARPPRKDGRSTGPFVSLHPLVRIHPETGEKLLFLNPGTTTHIVGLKERESQALLDLLFFEVTRPEYQVRFRWRPKSLVVWDNQAVAHAGPIDYAHFDLPRVVRRITVAGDLPAGPDGFRSKALEGELFNVLG